MEARTTPSPPRRRAGLAPADTERDEVRHALLMQAGLEEQRRSLRRLVVAHLRGTDDFVGAHPANRAWLARHPVVDEAAWTGGFELERELEGHGRVVLRFERNPLDALRLGTYVGSCLGVGGSYT
ncbi:MAG: hypothetical protein AAF682_26360 [Planctomycetota bacterium]